ncbi:general odorant-binding protein 2-like [Choristoneura fumiferana]|uniref:general odorant-binding protein 2-like n=1 Tax=Choristoneura fumiferana TaxID=7141 RepID=UPI003D1578ED
MVEMIFTKILLSVLFLCRAVMAGKDLKENIMTKGQEVANHCVKKNGFKKEVAEQGEHFWDEDFKPAPDTGCLVECMLQSYGIVDSNGNFDISRCQDFYLEIGADADKEKQLKDSMANCPYTVKGCDQALEYAMCFRRQYLKLFP